MVTYHGVQAKVAAKSTTPAFGDADDVTDFSLDQSGKKLNAIFWAMRIRRKLRVAKSLSRVASAKILMEPPLVQQHIR